MAMVVGLLLLVALALWWLGGKREAGPADADLPYQRRSHLLTPAERSFLGVLEQAVAGRSRVLAQVRLADLMTVRAGLPAARRTAAQNRINGKHVDFVLCDPDSLAIVAAIELDDASHQQASRQPRDRFLVQACEAAGLPLLRFEAKAGYSVAELRSRLATVLGDEAAARPAAAPAPSPTVLEDTRAMAAPLRPLPSASAPFAPSCPRCGAVTVLRQVSRGAHAGRQLWGCQRYPACRGFIPVS